MLITLVCKLGQKHDKSRSGLRQILREVERFNLEPITEINSKLVTCRAEDRSLYFQLFHGNISQWSLRHATIFRRVNVHKDGRELSLDVKYYLVHEFDVWPYNSGRSSESVNANNKSN